MSTRLKIILGLPTLGLLVLAGLAWYLGFFGDDPDEASLLDATAVLAETSLRRMEQVAESTGRSPT